MFNFNERTTGEKIVMIGAAALVAGNTVVNTINAVKIKNVKKRVNVVENQISSFNNRLNAIEARREPQPQVPQQPQNQDGGIINE